MPIIPKNHIDAFSEFMGNEWYINTDIVWYDNIMHEGNNKYFFLNVFDFEGEGSIPKQDKLLFLNLLRNISKGDKVMDYNGFAAMNVRSYPSVRWSNVYNQFKPRYLVFWGADPSLLGFKIKEMSGVNVNQTRMLRFPSLDVIEGNDVLQQQVVQLLKFLFNIR
jgi:hypothetical protein